LAGCLTIAGGLGILQSSDWLCAGGDAQHSNWQKSEKLITPATVKDLKLVWSRKLEGSLTAPVILGRMVTQKGIKDLVFVAGSADDVYAVDEDLGTLFWRRHLEEKSVPSALALAEAEPDTDADDDDNDITFGIRPLFVVTSERIYQLNPRTGQDFTGKKQPPPHSFENSPMRAIWQNAGIRQVVVTTIDGVKTSSWSANTGRPVSIAGANGVLFALSENRLTALNATTGEQLYRSGDKITAPITNSGLAIANGHVCFGDSAGTLYCFGFPIDI
jgi:outer membrane protein assembly factor BamB